jgi:SpoVK/Ycf46/Vps4 family AAA+-type ATPase
MSIRRRSTRIATPVLAPVTRLWILRMLVPLAGHRALLIPRAFSDDDLARALGLDEWIDPPDRDFDPAAILARLRELHRQAERGADRALPAILDANIGRLGELVGLSAAERAILGFATMLHHECELDKAADTLSRLSSTAVTEVLAQLLDLPAHEVRAALSWDGVLARSGLLSVDRSGTAVLTSKLDLLSKRFAEAVMGSETDPIALLRDTVAPSAPARLTLDDFPHLGEALAIVRPYLAQAIAANRQGVNILVHGAPGTGKSELTRALAAELGCELFEVASEDQDGDSVGGERRLRAYRAAQSFFDRRSALLLFDEVEDVFGDSASAGTAQRRKAWLNRTLEQNRVPTLWLTNRIDGIDPAFVRRFDVLVEVPVPPRAQRERILQAACGDLADAHSLARLAQAEALAPAVAERAASVVRAIRGEFDAAGSARALEWLASRTLEAQGHPGLEAGAAVMLPAHYDPAVLNADADLAALADGLARRRSARLCLYGPPGTGKSAYGRWLADRLGMPLLLKTASELMSKWVGESEKAIAAVFRRAAHEGAVLMIDEVDSFLRNREGARHSWEVTQVNEMLTRMEGYGGVFIASTNLMGDLDPAALRRFDMKIRFGYLGPEQAALLLARQCAALGIDAPSPEALAALDRLDRLTPGDFAALARRHRFTPFTNSAALVAALGQECALKGGKPAAIGFLA